MKLWLKLLSVFAVLSCTAVAQEVPKSPEPPRWGFPEDEVPKPGSLSQVGNDDLRSGWDFNNLEADKIDKKYTGKGLKIAVLDTPYDCEHPWLKPNIKGAYNAITKRSGTNAVQQRRSTHGTHVASTILKYLPDAELYLIAVLDDATGSGSVVDIAHGLEYAVEVFRVDIINMSLGGPAADRWIPPVLKKADEAGVLIFAAAGNAGHRTETEGYPARNPECISVAAYDVNNRAASFTSAGPNVFLAAPGVGIVAALPNNQKGAMDGTSMACPSAVGAYGGAFLQAYPELPKKDRPRKFREVFLQVASLNERSRVVGYGRSSMPKILATNPGGPVEPQPPLPGKPGVVLTESDLNEAGKKKLTDAGFNTFRLELNTASSGQQDVPVMRPLNPQQYPAVTLNWNSLTSNAQALLTLIGHTTYSHTVYPATGPGSVTPSPVPVPVSEPTIRTTPWPGVPFGVQAAPVQQGGVLPRLFNPPIVPVLCPGGVCQR